MRGALIRHLGELEAIPLDLLVKERAARYRSAGG
jgi:hypothetical protein